METPSSIPPTNAAEHVTHRDNNGENDCVASNPAVNWRIRKREQDRRAQRAARERNKRRIAELESTVDSLIRHGPGQQIANLKQQQEIVENQKNELSRALSAIQRTIAAVDMSTLPATPNMPGLATAATGAPNPPAEPVLGIVTDLSVPHRPIINETIPHIDLDLDSVVALDDTTTSVNQMEVPDICDCIIPPRAPETDFVHGCIRSTWRSANDILREPCDMSPYTLRVEEELSEDLPIRVVLYGWDHVQRSGPLTPLFEKLRRIDELQFSGCHQVERLAILTFMHMLLRFHINPTHGNSKDVPQWYLEAPSHILSTSYAIKFFVWPGVRDKFIYSQHRYCSNRFWELFVDGFRIAWPYDLRDCYKKNIRTGRYSLSSDFNRHTRDIRCWTMSADFLNEYPEMYSDIPISEPSPRYLGPPEGGAYLAASANGVRRHHSLGQVVRAKEKEDEESTSVYDGMSW